MKVSDIKTLDNISAIYCFRNTINNKCYVGQAEQLRKRLLHHINNFENCRYDAPLYRAMSKYGLDVFEVEILEIIDLRLEKELMEQTIDNVRYFPGWHMNKKNWYTIILDGRIQTEEVCTRIDESYRLAKK